MSWLEKVKQWLNPQPLARKPRPDGWNKTLSELSAENRSLTGDEIAWAREYETEQLRSWARFPMDGDVYEAMGEQSVTFLVSWRAPYSTGGEGVLPAGTRVRVSVHPGYPEPLSVQAMPLNADEMEQHLVAESDRLSSKYNGYCLSLPVSRLNTAFRLIASESSQGSVGE